jgi:superfamily II DNA or RNA helicase
VIQFEIKFSRVYFKVDSDEERQAIHRLLRIRPPGYEYSEKFQNKEWDGYSYFVSKAKDYFQIGFFWYVYKYVKRLGFEAKYVNFNYLADEKRNYSPIDYRNIDFGPLFIAKERDYQRDVIQAFFKKRYITVKLPTRSGKTYVVGEILRLLKDTVIMGNPFQCIFITDGLEALDQAMGDFETVTGIPREEYGVIQGSRFELKPITLAMIQTIESIRKSKKKERMKQKRDLSVWMKKTSLIVADEIHDHWEAKVDFTKKHHATIWGTLGVSATPWDKREIHKQYSIIRAYGAIGYEVKEAPLKSRGVFAENKCLFICSEKVIDGKGFNPRKLKGSNYQFLRAKCITHNVYRNKILMIIALVALKLRIKTLILFDQTDHGKIIESALKGRTTFLYGDHKVAYRNQVKQKFLEEDGGLLLASTIWNKAITLPEVEIIVNATDAEKEGLAIQKRGRAMGTKGDKRKALHIDFFDDYGYDYFKDHSLTRLATYRELTEVDMMDQPDLKKLRLEIEAYLKRWFEK